MPRILQALVKYGQFECMPPSRLDDADLSQNSHDEQDDSEVRTHVVPYESPKPQSNTLPVEDKCITSPLLLKYFIDGSMRTTAAGYVRDTKNNNRELFLSQVGVAATKLKDCNVAIEEYNCESTLWFPRGFADEDLKKAKDIVEASCSDGNFQLQISFNTYTPGVDKDKSRDEVRKQVLKRMHALELQQVYNLASNGKLQRESMLAIDGSLQFYQNLERNHEAFQNVVGIAKSFDLYQKYGNMNVATLVSDLQTANRTPARKIEHRNLKIGTWYLRLRPHKKIEWLRPYDGVVKVEMFPEDPLGDAPPLDYDRCNAVSQDIYSLRHPSTPMTDSRWASHIYPIYLTESYLKTQFHRDATIRACL